MKKLLCAIIILILASSADAQSVRPVRDSVGFCWNPVEMNRFINFLRKNYKEKQNDFPENIIAAISPHDDYLYAGNIYFPLYKYIKAKEIIIFGVTHGTVRRAMNDPRDKLILDDFDLWKGPYGNVAVSPLREMIKNRLNKDYYFVSDKAQKIEHSIEALIPFIQYYNRDFKITPVMVTRMNLERAENISDSLAAIISDYVRKKNYRLGKDIFFLISNDANHYGKDFDNSPYGLDSAAHRIATERDKAIIHSKLERGIDRRAVSELSAEIWESINPSAPLWCGRYPIVFGLLTAQKVTENISGKLLKGRLLKYSDTLTENKLPFSSDRMGFTAPVSEKHWVGFFSMLFGTE